MSTTISIIGAGYVGLVTGTCLAELGWNVICIDKDAEKIRSLQNGEIPIYEEGLQQLVTRNSLAGRLSFTTECGQAVRHSRVVFLAVGTPQGDLGQTDLTALKCAAKEIAHNLRDYTVVVVKSTVPVKTYQSVFNIILEYKPPDTRFDIISNPEFLRQGSAVRDFLYPDRIIVGGRSKKALTIMRRIYSSFIHRHVNYIESSNETAELIKYAANTFLAVKISYINEMADICEMSGADINQLARAMGLDKRIGPAFLKPGPGYGGSCLPKDVKSLIWSCSEMGYNFRIGAAVDQVNRGKRGSVVNKIRELLGPLENRNIALLGLAFKAETDDTRESPAIHVARSLLDSGASVLAYDPAAMDRACLDIPKLECVNSPYAACNRADLIIIMTEWNRFANLNYKRIHKLMARPIIYDTRNLLNPRKMLKLGFVYFDNGRVPFSAAVENMAHLRLGWARRKNARVSRKAGFALQKA